MRLTRVLKSVAMACVFVLTSAAASAQPVGAKGDDFLYRIAPNDTLEQLAVRFTQGRSVWPALQQHNQIEDPYRLSIGRVLKIPFSLIPELASSAQVSYVTGGAWADGKQLRQNDNVIEGQTVRTGPDGSATLLLADGSLLSVASDSSLAIERLQVFKGTGIIDSIISFEQGSLESQVDPQQKGVGRFEIRTPITITGVRGTNLRVHARGQGVLNEVIQGQAAVGAARTPEIAVRARQGVAVNQAGESLGVRQLLPPPALAVPVRGAGGWVMDFPAVSGAHSYLLRVTADPLGARLISSRRFEGPPVSFSASGPGIHYVFVRAVDDVGLGGVDARQAFEGSAVLQISDGTPVASGFGQMVNLAQY